MHHLKFTVTNFSCSACAKLCCMALQKLPSVSEVVADDKTGAVSLTAASPIEFTTVRHLLAQRGYRAVEADAL